MRILAILVAFTATALLPISAVAATAEPASTGTWFDGLEVGTCFDDAWDASGEFDYTIPAAIVPCDLLHDNEVVSRVALGDGDYPSGDLVAFIDDLCLAEYESFLGRPIASTLMFAFSYGPDEGDWAAGAHDALCSVYSSEPVIGSAASGSLRAPGETLAVYHEVDGKADLWLVDAGSGEATRNVTDNDQTKLITSPAWTPDGAAIAFSVQAGAGDEESDIYLVSVADGALGPLVEGPDREDGGVFSPDG